MLNEDKILINEINSLIREEMCINDSVKNESYSLVSLIKDKYEAIDKSGYCYNENGRCEIPFDFTYKFTEGLFENTKASVKVNCIRFKNDKSYANAINEEDYGTECYSIAKNIMGEYIIMIWVNFTVVGNKILSDLNDGVHHEINHIFQQVRITDAYKDFNKYNKYTNDLNHKDENIRAVSNLLYLTNEHEVDSFMNGMYGEVMNSYKNYSSVDEAIYDSTGFKKLKEMEQYYNYAVNNRDKIKSAVKKYDFMLAEFYKKIEKNAKRFKVKFGKTVMKIKDDLYGISEGYVRLSFNVMNENRFNNAPLFYNIIKLNIY